MLWHIRFLMIASLAALALTAAPAYMRKGAMIFLEIGYNQASGVSRLLEDRGFAGIQIVKDYSGNDRVALAVWSSVLG